MMEKKVWAIGLLTVYMGMGWPEKIAGSRVPKEVMNKVQE
jgi:hypothetical protein